jgi:hypothetical protein
MRVFRVVMCAPLVSLLRVNLSMGCIVKQAFVDVKHASTQMQGFAGCAPGRLGGTLRLSYVLTA